MAAGGPDAEREVSLKVEPKVAFYEGRLRAAEREQVRQQGMAACRVGKPLDACPTHPLLPDRDKLFCPWCAGWWDERIPTTKG